MAAAALLMKRLAEMGPRLGVPLVSLLVGALILGPAHSPAQETPEPDWAAIDSYIEREMASNGIPGLALAITRGDEVLAVRGYGAARDGQPVTPATQFYTGSLSKSFTAVAVMQLVEEGKIDLDQPVQAYLPTFTTTDPDSAARITVRHLLNQTSGLADAGFPAYTLPQPDSIEERVASLRDARPVSEPGMVHHYFNPNYELLAGVVEAASGEPFSQYLRDHIFAPLDMSNTASVITSAETSQAAPGLAQGHILAFGVPIPRDELDGYLGGSGGVISTAEDMANYLILHTNDGRFGGTAVVSPESVELMHTPPQGIDSPYAMGWLEVNPEEGPRRLEHNGVLSAFHADMALLPEQGYGIALLYNHSYTLAGYEGIKQGLIALLVGRQPAGSGLGAARLGLILAGLLLLATVLQVRGLLRLRRWAQAAEGRPLWRLAAGIVWKFLPAALLIGLQPLVGFFSGRVFSYWQLFLAMPDVVTYLGVNGVLGAITGLARIAYLARR